ncbi:MAG: kelch repeat-containing protein [Bacteroidia bacterium]|nr:kelch repeat-containing protein [Bacteroidia bacterium]
MMIAFSRYSLLSCFYFFLFSVSFGQNWQPLSDASIARWLPGGLLLEDKLYVLSGFTSENGFDEKIIPSFEVYDIPTDSWTTLTHMPLSKYESSLDEAGVTHTANVLVNDSIWVIGGRTGDHPGPVTEEVWIYDTKTDVWHAGPDLPRPIANGYCVNIGRTLHYIGGFFNACSGMSEKHYTLDLDAWQANPSSVSWEDYRAPLPVGRAHISVVALGGKIYAFGGEDNHDCCYGGLPCRTDLKDVFVYDVETDVWTTMPDLPYARSHSELASFALDGKVVQVGSEVHSTISKTTLQFDPSTGLWTEATDWEFPELIMAPAVGIYKDSLIITHGGYPARGDPKTTAQYTKITRNPNYEIGWGKDTLDFWVYQGLSATQKALAWTLSGALDAELDLETPVSWITKPGIVSLDLVGRRIPIEVNSNGLAEGSYFAKLILKGNGPDVVDPAVSVAFSPDTIVVKLTVGQSPDGVVLMEQTNVCDKVEVGSSHTFPVEVMTPGANAINLNAASFSNSEFVLSGALPSSIPAGGSQTINVTFTPSAYGSLNSSFTLNHDGNGGFTQIDLGCRAIPTCIVPSDWVSTSLGSPAIEGSACVTDQSWRISAAGNNIWSTKDQGHFIAKEVSGDGDMIFKVNWATEQDEDTKIGIMFRNSLDESSANVFLRINPNHHLAIQYRPGDGQNTYKEIAIGYYPPHWLKLDRQGDVYTAYESEDGINWSLLNNSDNPVTVELNTTIYAGIAFTSHNTSALAEAEIEGMQLNFNNAVFPVVLNAFEAELIDGSVLLEWKVELEENFSHYEVERRTENNTGFRTVGVVSAEGKDTYQSWDSRPEPGSNVYRLAMHDIDGTIAYSDQIEVEVGAPNAFAVRMIEGLQAMEMIWFAESADAKLRLMDITGRQLWLRNKELHTDNKYMLNLPGLSPGYYVIEANWNGRFRRKLFLIK